MNAVLHGNNLEHYGVRYTGRKNLEVSGESVVPDVMPDIGQLGDTNAHVLLRSKRTENGRCVMEGTLSLSVSFLPDGASGVRVLNFEMPWETQLESDLIFEGAPAVGNVKVMRMDTRLLNPRKLLVKCVLVCEAAVYERQETLICDSSEDRETVQVRTETAEVGMVSTVCERTFAATDEYPLAIASKGTEIIGKYVQFRVEDIKTLTNKLIIKGSVLSDVVLSTENGEPERVSFISGFSFIAETDREQVSDDVRVTIMPNALYYELSSDGRVLNVEVHAVCQMVVYEKKTISYLSDAYSNFYTCECEFENLRAFTNLKTGQHRENLNGSISGRSQISHICFLTASYLMGDEVETAQAIVQISAYVKYDNGVYDWLKKTVQLPLKKRAGEIVTSIRLGDLYGVSAGTDVEYRFTAELELREETECNLQLLTAVTINEEQTVDRNRPSLTVIRSDAELWDLAREYGSTVALIRQYNELPEESVESKPFLLIPKQRK